MEVNDEVKGIIRKLNAQFLSEASEIWLKSIDDKWFQTDEPLDCSQFVILRTIHGKEPSTLFVIDVDYMDIYSYERKYYWERGMEISRRLYKTAEELMQRRPFEQKASGACGFHLYCRMSGTKDIIKELQQIGDMYFYMKEIMKLIVRKAGYHIAEDKPIDHLNLKDPELICTTPKVRDIIRDEYGVLLPMIDASMFQRNRKIRAYSINFKTGMFSVPVNIMKDSYDTIMAKQKLEILPEDIIDIPEFGFAGLLDIEELKKKMKEKNGKGKSFKHKPKIVYDQIQVPDCIKGVVSQKAPSHWERWYLAVWLKECLGYDWNHIFNFIKLTYEQGRWIDFNPTYSNGSKSTPYQLDQIFDVDYRCPACATIMGYGVCTHEMASGCPYSHPTDARERRVKNE